MIVLKEAGRCVQTENRSLEVTVAEILETTRSGGDEALLDYSERFDGVRPVLRVDRERIKAAYDEVDPAVKEAISFAAARIEGFAIRQKECIKGLEYEISPGVTLGHRLLPVASCGCYVPAGQIGRAHV